MAAESAEGSSARAARKPMIVQAYGGHAKRVADMLHTTDLLALMSTCRFFTGHHGERMLHEHALSLPRPEPSPNAEILLRNFPLPGDKGWEPALAVLKEKAASGAAGAPAEAGEAAGEGAAVAPWEDKLATLMLRRHLLVRQTMSPCTGLEGVNNRYSIADYYRPCATPAHKAFFSKIFVCRNDSLIDFTKPILASTGPGTLEHSRSARSIGSSTALGSRSRRSFDGVGGTAPKRRWRAASRPGAASTTELPSTCFRMPR